MVPNPCFFVVSAWYWLHSHHAIKVDSVSSKNKYPPVPTKIHAELPKSCALKQTLLTLECLYLSISHSVSTQSHFYPPLWGYTLSFPPSTSVYTNLSHLPFWGPYNPEFRMEIMYLSPLTVPKEGMYMEFSLKKRTWPVYLLRFRICKSWPLAYSGSFSVSYCPVLLGDYTFFYPWVPGRKGLGLVSQVCFWDGERSNCCETSTTTAQFILLKMEAYWINVSLRPIA